jgi:hypothetical protein
MLSYALISSSKVSRVRAGIAWAVAARAWLALRGLLAGALVASAGLASSLGLLVLVYYL